MISIDGKTYGDILARLRAERPLVHHITNLVVSHVTANITLAAGGLPVMANAVDEVEEMVNAASALVLNIGTLTPVQVEAMRLAGRRARQRGIPVVFDPVGAGATRMRTEAARRILDEVRPAIIRGNAAEISILAGQGGQVRGVESVGAAADLPEVAAALAREQQAVVAITGPQDVVCDGRRLALVDNGHPLMGSITGTGCMSTTVVACFAAVERDPLTATAAALAFFGLAGETAARRCGGGPGSFQVALHDAVALLGPSDLAAGASVALGDGREAR